jgi:hypothetical protein
LRKLALTALAVISLLFAAGTAGATGALVKLGNLVLVADGGFSPRTLPQHHFAPIAFEGHLDLKELDGAIPPPLSQLVVHFDRDGRISTAGLPTCDPARLQEVTPEEARARCSSAIVGTGHVKALIARSSGAPYEATAPVTLFNGPPENGHPTVVFHTRTTVPATQNFVIVIPIEPERGRFRYRATLVHLDVHIGRRYRFRGAERSYVSARCSDNVLSTRGRFEFADKTVIEGSVEKACTFR